MSLIPNVSLVKEQSRPEVYFICGGAKFWIPSPEEFDAMGFDWAKIQIVPDGTLDTLPSKPFVNPRSRVKPSDVFFAGGMSKDPAAIVAKNIMLAGWLDDSDPREGEGSRSPFPNCIYEHNIFGASWEAGAEDFHYDFVPDPDFIQKMYGQGGLSFLLNGVVLHGNVPSPGNGNPMRFDDISEIDGSSRGVTLNSFALPGNKIAGNLNTLRVCLIGELNCWHKTGKEAKGEPPDGWISRNYCALDPDWGAYWPYDPSNPDGGAADLQRGDYVLMKGTLWQDNPHGVPHTLPWDRGATEGHAGWLEMHPIDWIVRVAAPPPGQRKTTLLVERCTPPSNLDSIIDTGSIHIYPDFDKFYPAFEVSSLQEKKAQVLKVREVVEFIDGRYTDMATVWKHFALNMRDHVEVQVGVRHSGSTGQQGRFKGVYIVTWEVPGPAICSSDPNQDRLDLFVRGTNDELSYRWFSGNPWSASAWQSLGGTLTSDAAAVALGPGLIYVFARGTDNALWYTWLSGGVPSGWNSLGGVLTSSPAACSSAPDRLDVFGRGTDNTLYYQYFDGNTRSWSGWQSLGGVLTSDPSAMAMSGAAWVFARGTDNAFYFMWLRSLSDRSGWQRLDGIWTSGPAVCSSAPERDQFDVFGRGTDNALWHNRFDGRAWSGWQSLGGVLTSDPSAMAMSGAAWVFARGTDNAFYFMWLRSLSDRSGWQRLG